MQRRLAVKLASSEEKESNFESKIEVVITADDLGASMQRNAGILRCLQEGAVTATSVLANGSAASQGVELMARSGHLYCLGLHLNLTEGAPLSDPTSVPSLLSPGTAYFRGKEGFWRASAAGELDADEVALEATAQLMWLNRSIANAWTNHVKRDSEVRLGGEGQGCVGMPGHLCLDPSAASIIGGERCADEPPSMVLKRKRLHVDGHQHCHVAPGIPLALAPVFKRHGVAAVRIPEETGALRHAPCSACARAISHSPAAREIYSRHGFVSSDAFVGCSLCGFENYRKEDIVDAVWVQAERILASEGSSTLNRSTNRKLVVEVMVHPGYCGDLPPFIRLANDAFFNSRRDDGYASQRSFEADAAREVEMNWLCDSSFRELLEALDCELRPPLSVTSSSSFPPSQHTIGDPGPVCCDLGPG